MDRKYRIGALADELGVTPSFLKNCEKAGILETHTEDNGYRYYAFNQIPRIYEFMKLQNQGYSSSEIHHLLFESSADELVGRMDGLRTELKKKLIFEEALLEYYDLAEQTFRRCAEDTWFIEERGDFYFLPHAIGTDIIGTEETRRIVRSWKDYFPIVWETAQYRFGDILHPDVTPMSDNGRRGLAVSCAFAEAAGLPVGDPVVQIPQHRALVIYRRHLNTAHDSAYQRFHRVKELCSRFSVPEETLLFGHVFLKLQEDGDRYCYCVYEIPLP